MQLVIAVARRSSLFCQKAFVNHTQTLHKSLIVDKPNKDLINNFLQTSAFVVGPVTSGYFFDKKGGVSYVFFIASSLLLINILNSMTVKHEVKEKSSFVFMDTVLRRMWSSVATGVDTLKRSNIKENWDLLVLKSLMVANATVLFTKFPAILKHNFRLGSFLIGCTSGYQQILMYASGASAPFMKRNLFVSVPNIQRLVIWTVLFVTSLIVVCFAASHNHYLVMYMPMILGRSLVDNIWLDLAVMRKNSFLINAADIVTLVTRLIVPFTVGTLCLIYGHIAIKISMIVPVVLVLLLILLKGKSLDIIRRLSVTKIDLSKSNKAD